MQGIYRFLVIVSIFMTANVTAENTYWTQVFKNQLENNEKRNSKASQSALYQLDISSLSHTLIIKEGDQSVKITVPLPNGHFAQFNLSPSKIMAASLANKYPNIKTFSGFEVGKPQNKGRFDITMHGFHGVFNYEGDKVFIEPISRDNNKIYHSYFRSDSQPVSNSVIGKRFEPKKDEFRLEQ